MRFLADQGSQVTVFVKFKTFHSTSKTNWLYADVFYEQSFLRPGIGETTRTLSLLY